MMPDPSSLVRSVLEGCTVDPPGGFQWFGQWIPTDAFDGGESRGNFLRTLALHLYLHVFCAGEAAARLPPPRSSSAGEIRALLTAHSLANPDRERWDSGWTYVGKSGDAYLVHRKGLDFSVSEGNVRTPPGEALRAGSEVQVLVPADRWSLSPGYVLIYGERLLRPRSVGIRRTRLYLNLDVPDARRVIGMCRCFNEAELPFTLKVAGHPAAYDRCDTVILFVERDEYRRASELLVGEATRSALTPRLPVPAFTRRLAPGVAVADDPHAPESFGESRCRLLAEGILRAHEAGDTSFEAQLREVEKAFLTEGVLLETTHLESGSAEYEIGPWSHWSIS